MTGSLLKSKKGSENFYSILTETNANWGARTTQVSLVNAVFQVLPPISLSLTPLSLPKPTVQSLSNMRLPCFYSHSHHLRPNLHTSNCAILVVNPFNQRHHRLLLATSQYFLPGCLNNIPEKNAKPTTLEINLVVLHIMLLFLLY